MTEEGSITSSACCKPSLFKYTSPIFGFLSMFFQNFSASHGLSVPLVVGPQVFGELMLSRLTQPNKPWLTRMLANGERKRKDAAGQLLSESEENSVERDNKFKCREFLVGEGGNRAGSCIHRNKMWIEWTGIALMIFGSFAPAIIQKVTGTEQAGEEILSVGTNGSSSPDIIQNATVNMTWTGPVEEETLSAGDQFMWMMMAMTGG